MQVHSYTRTTSHVYARVSMLVGPHARVDSIIIPICTSGCTSVHLLARATQFTFVHACAYGWVPACFSRRCSEKMSFMNVHVYSLYRLKVISPGRFISGEFDAVSRNAISGRNHNLSVLFYFWQPKQHGSQPATLGHSGHIWPRSSTLNHH